MQIKTTVKYHLTPIRMAAIKKPENKKYWWECGEIGTLCIVGGKVDAKAALENSVAAPQKIKNRVTIWSSHSTSGYKP